MNGIEKNNSLSKTFILKKRKMLLILFLLVCLIKTEEEVEINGEKKYILAHVIKSLMDPNYPPSTTDVVRYNNSNLYLVGDLTKISQSDVSEIIDGNYVYCISYMAKKTRLEYKEVGAIVIGTTDKKICFELIGNK